MTSENKYVTQYPDCLRNSRDLQLGPIFLRYLGYEQLPSLLTIYELERPSVLTFTEIDNLINELKNQDLSEYAINGIFSLGIAYFETMLSDLMRKKLQFYPQNIALLKKKNGENKEIAISQIIINKGGIVESIIENEIHKLSYKDIETQMIVFCDIASVKFDFIKTNLDNLIEIKETRNLLLHNNLFVNEFYLNKTKSVKRSNQLGEKLKISKQYALESLLLISSIVENIILELREKYKKYTLLYMLQNLWSFTFKNKMIKMEDFSILNYEKDIFDGPFTEPNFLSSSEKTYMEFWRAQRDGTPLNSPAMVHLGSGTKLAFLVDVFGELRLTYW